MASEIRQRNPVYETETDRQQEIDEIRRVGQNQFVHYIEQRTSGLR